MQSLINKISNDNNWKEKLRPKVKPSLPSNLPRGFGRRDIEDRWKLIQKMPRYNQSTSQGLPEPMSLICPEKVLQTSEVYKSNIENFIGVVEVPLGVVGPLRINGLNASGDYFVPLATTEAALIASYNRGVRALSEAGGISCAVIEEGISRDPCFVFNNLTEMTEFVAWANNQFAQFKSVAETTTRHGKLKEIKYMILSNMVHVKFNYTTGDASGQNMVTIATEAVINYIKTHCPVKPTNVYLEGGMSSDKKGSRLHLVGCRGKKVIAECIVPKKIVETVFKVTVQQMADFQTMASASQSLPATLGSSLHYSNAITAMSIALGQDPACAAEAHIGITHGYVTENGDMYCSVMLPNLLIATMGGGTKLPFQRACLDMMGVYGANKANELAEIVAAVCLAGELSLTAAIVSDDFARAHQILARGDIQITSNSSIQDKFEKAAVEIMRLPSLPNRDVMIKVYGLYKQATVGDINIGKPKLVSDLKTKAKYKSWKKRRGTSKEDAMKEYIALIEGLLGHEIGAQVSVRPNSANSGNATTQGKNNGMNGSVTSQVNSPSQGEAKLPSSGSFEITQDDVNEVAAIELNLSHLAPEERINPVSPTTPGGVPNEEQLGNQLTIIPHHTSSSGSNNVVIISDGRPTAAGEEQPSVQDLKRQIAELTDENNNLRMLVGELRSPFETMKKILDRS